MVEKYWYEVAPIIFFSTTFRMRIARGGVGEDLEIMVIGIIKTKNEIVSTINLVLREGQGQKCSRGFAPKK